MPPYSMLTDITPELQGARWSNAKFIVNQLKNFCLSNDLGFIFEEEGIIYTQDQIIINDKTNSIYVQNKNMTHNMYINCSDSDEGTYETTEEWMNRCSLFNCKFIKLISESDFNSMYKVEGDSLTFRNTI